MTSSIRTKRGKVKKGHQPMALKQWHAAMKQAASNLHHNGSRAQTLAVARRIYAMKR